MINDLPVKSEVTNWRDLDLSKRHREWGFDCPAVDVDFLLIEYDMCEPKALIEYKRDTAAPFKSGHPTYKAINKLCHNAGIPFFVVIYDSLFSWFKVIPHSAHAKLYYQNKKSMLTEKEYISFLYDLRGRSVPG